MSTAPEVVPIFATPFGVLSLPRALQRNPALAALFSSRALPPWSASDARVPATAFRSRDDLTQWPEEEVRLLLQEMLAGVTAVARSVSELDADQFALLRPEARGWFTLLSTNGYLPAESHANASWVAVYCVATPPPSLTRQDSGVLRLREFRAGNMFMDAAAGVTRIPYRSGHCTWRPVAGHIAVFPAMIAHDVALLRAPGPLILVTTKVRFVGAEQPWMPPW